MSQEARMDADDGVLARVLHAPLSILDCLAYFALALMLILVSLEVVLRALFGLSLEVADELSSYALVAMLFCSAPRVMLNGSFLRVDIFYAKFKGRVKHAFDALYSVLALAITAIYIHEAYGLVASSLRRGSKSTTLLETPLYIPQTIIVVGMTALAVVLLALLAASIRRLRRPGDETHGDKQ